MTEALRPYVARSAALHAAAVAVVLLLARGSARKTTKVYMIDFVGGPAVLQTAGAASSSSGPREEEAAKPTQQAERDTFATRKSRGIALPRPSLLKGWTEKKTPLRPSLSQADAPAVAAAAGPAAGMPGDAAGIETDLPNFPYPWYISQVRQMLWSAWQKRMPGSTGEGIVVFAIVRNGEFTDLRMESSSGDAAFDDAAVESVRAAAPFPALPSDFKEHFLKIHLTLKSEERWR